MNSGNSEHNLSDLVEEFLAYQSAVRNLSDNSLRAYRLDLEKMENLLMTGLNETKVSLSILAISSAQLRLCVGALSREKKAESSINRFIAAVRNFFAYCKRFDYIKVNPALELKTIKQPTRVPRFMTAAEVHDLCTQPERNDLLWEARDRALFEMLYSSGCRVSEIAGIKIADLSEKLDSAMVIGKGGKDRRVFFSPQASAALRLYLLERKKRLNKDTGSLFINQMGTKLTVRGIRFIVSRYSSLEGTNRHVSPHAFRHTFATSMIAAGADVRHVQELLGHSSISTTQRYTHITNAELMEIYKRAHPHGKKRDT